MPSPPVAGRIPSRPCHARPAALVAVGALLLAGCGNSSSATSSVLGQTGAVGPAGTSLGVVANVQVTADRDGHAEPSIAVDPRNPRVILGATQFLTMAGDRVAGTFSSNDGGRTWHDNGLLPLPSGFAQAIDTTTAFLPDGTGYVCAFALAKGASSFASRAGSSALLLWRTTDGGRTFTAPTNVYQGSGFQDHPWLAAGPGTTLYLAWTNRSGLVFSRSVDGGTSFSAPAVLVRGAEPANAVVVVSGGIVGVFYEETHESTTDIGLVTLSPAGRVIRSTPVIASGASGVPSGGPKRDLFFPLFAATSSAHGRFLAVAIPVADRAVGHPAIEVWHTDDEGRTWQGPRPLASGTAAQLTQLQPQLGVIGGQLVASFFTESRSDVYSEWFASAHAPFARFGMPRLVSTTRFRARGWIGDYQALATGDDTVHLAWNDGRTGRLQIYSATITNP